MKMAFSLFYVIARSAPAWPEARSRRDGGGQAEGDAAICVFRIPYEIASGLPPPRESRSPVKYIQNDYLSSQERKAGLTG